ncbi:MAG: PIG-L family deacetylase [Eubacteriales bacterium]|nr:PIG-L family deacetylase [Eubacteriales bacterium]
MQFKNGGATLFIPDGAAEETAFSRTTHLCVGAHQDDIEFMAYHAIADCYQKPNMWFSGVVVTDGAGSPRSGAYAGYTGENMKAVRCREQQAAAMVGGYSLVTQLGYTSADLKNKANTAPVEELARLFLAMRPALVYTHNLADRHGTHLAVCLRVLSALRAVRAQYQPKALYGMEVWRSLDWLSQQDKCLFDASKHPNIAAGVSACFDSQITGGKRYDTAVLGRRAANATFGLSHAVDTGNAVEYGMDMTALITSDEPPAAFLARQIDRFRQDAISLINEVGSTED